MVNTNTLLLHSQVTGIKISIALHKTIIAENVNKSVNFSLTKRPQDSPGKKKKIQITQTTSLDHRIASGLQTSSGDQAHYLKLDSSDLVF